MSERTEQGVAVRSGRVSKRMTQAHLATAAGVSEKTVRRMEAGGRVGPESLRAVCAVLGIDATLLSTEAECVPDAADEARRHLAERKRRAALLVGVLTASLAATSATTVFNAPEMARMVRALALGAIYIVPAFLTAALLTEWQARRPDPVKGALRASAERALRPIRFVRHAAGGAGGTLAALRVASLPPAVLLTLHAIKGAMADQSQTMLYGTLTFIAVSCWIAISAVRDASGLDVDGAPDATASV